MAVQAKGEVQKGSSTVPPSLQSSCQQEPEIRVIHPEGSLAAHRSNPLSQPAAQLKPLSGPLAVHGHYALRRRLERPILNYSSVGVSEQKRGIVFVIMESSTAITVGRTSALNAGYS